MNATAGILAQLRGGFGDEADHTHAGIRNLFEGMLHSSWPVTRVFFMRVTCKNGSHLKANP